MLREGLQRVALIVLGAHREDDPTPREPLRVTLKSDVGLALAVP